MLTGLVTTCLVTLIGCASWYQRRSRHGWVDELDMVRGDALTAPRGEMATAVAIAEASDARDRLHGVSMSWDVSATPSTGADPEDLHHSDAIQDEFGPVDPRAEQATDALFDTEIWTQPSPHPIRPSEMWHPGVGPSALACDGVPVDPAGASEGTTRRRRFARFRPVAPDSTEAGPGQDVTEGILASAPVGDVAPAVPHPSSGGLLRGPVSRRGRVDRVRPALPTVPDLHRADVWEDGPDRSPLPEARLGPAQPPRRRVPQAPDGPRDTGSMPSIGASPGSAAEVTSNSSGAPESDPGDLPAAPLALLVDDRYEVTLGSTVLRFNEGHRTSLRNRNEGPEVVLTHGWCWVTTLGSGPTVPVRIGLPNAELVVAAGGRALAMVEDDGSAFLVVIEGSAELICRDESTSLSPGLMALLATEGIPQVDRAERSEIESDPLVARNRGLDATR